MLVFGDNFEDIDGLDIILHTPSGGSTPWQIMEGMFDGDGAIIDSSQKYSGITSGRINSGNYTHMFQYFAPQNKGRVEVSFRLSTDFERTFLFLLSSGLQGQCELMLNQTNKIYYNNAQSFYDSGYTLSLDSWYKVTIQYDMITKKWSAQIYDGISTTSLCTDVNIYRDWLSEQMDSIVLYGSSKIYMRENFDDQLPGDIPLGWYSGINVTSLISNIHSQSPPNSIESKYAAAGTYAQLGFNFDQPWQTSFLSQYASLRYRSSVLANKHIIFSNAAYYGSSNHSTNVNGNFYLFLRLSGDIYYGRKAVMFDSGFNYSPNTWYLFDFNFGNDGLVTVLMNGTIIVNNAPFDTDIKSFVTTSGSVANPIYIDDFFIGNDNYFTWWDDVKIESDTLSILIKNAIIKNTKVVN